MVSEEYISREAAIKSTWMILRGMGYAAEDNPDLVKTVAAVFGTAPAADVVEVVRCRECIHRPSGTGVNHHVEFPDEVCPCQCLDDPWYSWMPRDDWYCASGVRKDGGQDE